MVRGEKISGGILFVVFSIALFMSMSFPNQSRAFPVIVNALGMLLSGMMVLFAFVKERKGQDVPVKGLTKDAMKMVVIMAAVIILYAVAIKPVGFCVSTYIFLVISMVICHQRKTTVKTVGVVALISLIVTGIIYFVFKTLLYVPLPQGLLF